MFARIWETGLNCNVVRIVIPFTGEIFPACLLLLTVSSTKYTGEVNHLHGHGNLGFPESRSLTAFDDQRPLERNVIYLSVYVYGYAQSYQSMQSFKRQAGVGLPGPFPLIQLAMALEGTQPGVLQQLEVSYAQLIDYYSKAYLATLVRSTRNLLLSLRST